MDKNIAGLKPRLEAAEHLSAVLRGKQFTPISASVIADQRDRALANRLVTVALRRHGQISEILKELLARGIPKKSGTLEAILRIGIAQLLYMPEMADHSALHLSVEAAKKDNKAQAFAKLANGVLRTVQREAEKFLALDDSLLVPQSLRTQWQAKYGAEAVQVFAQALIDGAPLDITFPDGDADTLQALGAEFLIADTYRIVARDKSVINLEGFDEGKWWVQDVSAAIPARLLYAKQGQDVLDVCAAPGGKTMQLAKAGAFVTAVDVDGVRMERVQQNLDRVGLDAKLVVSDALGYSPNRQFDKILIDAPCSATGTFRRHPEVLWQRDDDGIKERVQLQRKLISHAVKQLKSGGEMVYCVCSLETAEGENQVGWTLKNNPELELVAIRPEELDGWAEPILHDGTLRLHPALSLPNEKSGSLDGFFVARFRKL